MTPDAIRWKVKSGQWQPVYRGVYAAIQGQLPRESRLWAVILRVNEKAVLSHETAAELWDFAPRVSTKIHVTVSADKHPTRWHDLRGVVVHRSVNLRTEPQPWFALPRTPIAHTVIDLVESVRDLDEAYSWLSRAVTKNKCQPGMIIKALDERKKVRRHAWLDDALADVSDGVHFPLERRWVRDVERAHGLPKPTRQAKRNGADGVRFLDNFYEQYGIAVELDGQAFHPPEDRDADRYRDNETAIAADAQVLRYGFRQVANRPCDQASQFTRALVRRGWGAETLRPCKRPGCAVAGAVRKLREAAPRPSVRQRP